MPILRYGRSASSRILPRRIDAFFSILPGVCSLDEAMNTETAQKNMRNAAEQVFRLILDLYEHKT